MFVEKQLNALKRGKSAGHDNIPPGMLKDGASELATPLSCIMNLSLRTGVVPLKWKIAKVTPIHKSGPTSSFDNYRPISVHVADIIQNLRTCSVVLHINS